MPNLHSLPLPAPVQHPSRVITQAFQERLSVLNQATRELRQMGFKVVWTNLSGAVPQAHVQCEATVSMAPLLDRMTPPEFHCCDGVTVISGGFMGVVVSWINPSNP